MKISRSFRYALGLCGAVFILAGCSSGGSSQVAPSSPMQQTAAGSGLKSPLGRVRKNIAPGWTVYDYNPSGRALFPQPAQYDGTTASFTFVPSLFTALLTTGDKSLTGDLTGKTLNDTVTVSGATGTFVTQNGGGCGNPAAVRFYFTTPGFAYTNFWWSNPESYVLANGTATLTAPLTDPSQWSDFNGQSGSSDPSDFYAAVAKVHEIGLSYGGDCFFENGATVNSGTALFSSQFSEI